MKIPAAPAILILSAVGSFSVTRMMLPWAGDWQASREVVPWTERMAAAGGGKPGESRQAALAARLRTVLELLGIPGEWAEELAAAETSGFPALLNRMETLPARQREQLRGLLFGRWAGLDPAGAVALLGAYPLKNDLSDFLRHWARLDFAAAVAKAEELGPDLLRRTAQDRALLDAEGVIQWLEGRADLNPVTLFNSDARENREALRLLAEQDPRRMLAWSRQLPEEKLKPQFVQDLAAGLAKVSPEEALEWAKSLKDTARSHAALAGAAGVLAATDPRRALEIAAGMKATGRYDPAEFQYAIAQKLDLSHADQVLAWLAPFPDSAFLTALTKKVVIDQLNTDPAKAFAMAASLGGGAGMTHLIELPRDMAASVDSARQLLEAAAGAPGSSLRDTASKEALLRWMETSPASLAEYLKGRMDTPFLKSMREGLQAGLAVMKMRDGAVDPALLEIVGFSPEVYVKELSANDPEKAIAALGQVEDAAARHRLAGEIADKWSKYNRTGVMEWAAGLQDPGDQAAAWREVATAWTREDSLQASNWISTLQAGPGRDAAVKAMAWVISGTDPDLAWKWALSMSDPAQRAESLVEAAESWRSRDPAALEAALNDGALPAAERAKVLEKLRLGDGK